MKEGREEKTGNKKNRINRTITECWINTTQIKIQIQGICCKQLNKKVEVIKLDFKKLAYKILVSVIKNK